MIITFLGAGAYGQILAHIATQNGHDVKFYDPYKYPDIDLASACQNADALIYVAPSSVASEILPQLPPKTPLICASKGFLSAEPFARSLNFSVLAGPAYAADLEKHESQVAEHLTLTASSPLAAKIFATDWLHIEQATDTTGILLCGALKNLYAYGAGLLGVQPVNLEEFKTDPATYRQHHQYLNAAYHEIKQILQANSADPATADLSCGLPDLALTCTEQSRNFRAGRATAKGQAPEQTTTEALNILQSIPDNFHIPPEARVFKTILRSQNV